MTLRRIEKVTVEHWRSWQGPVRLGELGSGLVILSGPNAIGKSGLWEAIVLGLLDRHWGQHTSEIAPAGTEGVSPRVELEMTAGGGRFRIEKHFGTATSFRDRATLSAEQGSRWKVTHQGEEAYRETRRLVLGDETGSPGRGGFDNAVTDTLMQVLLPRQGELVAQLPSPRALSLAVTDQSTAAAATRLGRLEDVVSHEADAIWVGQRNRPRRNTELDRVRSRREEIAARQGELEASAEGIRTLVAQLARFHGELEGFGDARSRLAEADELDRSAREHRAKRETARARFEEAETAAKAAAENRSRRTTLIETATAATAELTAARSRLAAGEIEQERAEKQLTTATRRLEERQQVAASLRSWVEHEGRQSELEHLRERVAALAKRLDAVREHQRILAETDAALERLTLPDETEWQELEGLLAALAEARARLHAGAWQLRAKLSAGWTLEVDGEEVPGPDVDRGATRSVELSVPSGARLELTAPAANVGEATRLETALADFFARFESPDLETLQRRRRTREAELLPRREIALRTLTDALEGQTETELIRQQARIEAQSAELERLEPPASERPEGSPSTWKTRADVLAEDLSELQQGQQAASRAAGEAATRLSEARTGLTRAEAAEATALDSLAADRESRGPDDDLSTAAGTTAERASALQSSWRELEEARDLAETTPEARAGQLREGFQEAHRLESAIQSTEGKLDHLRREDPEGALATLESELAALEPKLRSLEIEAEALRLLERALQAERQRLTAAVGEPVRLRMQRWLSYLLQDRSHLEVDEQGRPTRILTPTGDPVRFQDQSFGTREQLSVLYRLAVADLLAEDAEAGVCLLLDDPFGHTDRARRRRMLEILASEARRRDHQILVFTCRPEDFEGVGTAISLTTI